MKNTDWPAEAVADVARSSGRPLEVEAALAFQKKNWTAQLGSYFSDGTGRPPRELDVLLEKGGPLGAPDKGTWQVRVTLSCKGFPANTSPLAYSVSRTEVPGYPHRFLLLNSSRVIPAQGEENWGGHAATLLIDKAGLTAPKRKLVAYDIVKREEATAAKGKPPLSEQYSSTYTDKKIFEGLDSALKAAIYWRNSDRLETGRRVVMYVPVLVLGMPFWDVSMDGGVIGEAMIARRGYQTCSYPVGDFNETLTTLVWTRDELPELVAALDELCGWLSTNLSALP